MRTIHFSFLLVVASILPVQAEFLYQSFLIPSFYNQTETEYSEWDIFSAAHDAANFPDIAAPNGIKQTRTAAGFPANDPAYEPDDAIAFWNTANPTLTQTNPGAASFILGPGSVGNIYNPTGVMRFELADNTPYMVGTVSYQFQTEGKLPDFDGIRLVYNDGTQDVSLAATDYLREYRSGGSSFGGYGNRAALQWDLTGLDISSYKIVLLSQEANLSFQQAVLDTSASYTRVIPATHTWNASGPGTWSDGGKWLEGSTSVANANVRFTNTAAANITLDSDRTIGELIFQSPANATIAGASFTSNTGITTSTAATGLYSMAADWKMGAFNVFHLASGTVDISGVLSGNYGFLKSGAGTLVLKANNTFTGGITVDAGTLRIEGANTYTGTTTVLFGSLIVAADAGTSGALGNSNTNINVGASDALYADSGSAAELFIDGDHTISRNIILAQGPYAKRLGGTNTTTSGAVFSGTVNLGVTAASNVHFTAPNATDRVTFSGAITGGATNATLHKGGAGTVVFSGVSKTYHNATTVDAGTLQIATGFTGNGNLTVSPGARLLVDGNLGGSGNLLLTSGLIGGSGTVGRVFTVDAGDRLAPGNSVGQLTTIGETWGGGGIYQWELNNATGSAGTGWDLLAIDGLLQIEASAAAPFSIELTSLTASNLAGLAENFDANSSHLWKIATTTNGIAGFSADAFALDLSHFQNPYSGTFAISQIGNDLSLSYTIPEPSTYALFAAGAALLVWKRRSRST